MRRDDIIQNEIIRMSIFLKINQLKRESFSTLTYTHIINVLFYFIWSQKLPTTIHQAIDDIMRLDANTIVAALHTIAMIEGSKMDLNKINDLLGGK